VIFDFDIPAARIRTQEDYVTPLPAPNAFFKSMMAAGEKKRPLDGGLNKNAFKISFSPTVLVDSPLPGNLLAESWLFDSGTPQVIGGVPKRWRPFPTQQH
jgi:hypothetical protein